MRLKKLRPDSHSGDQLIGIAPIYKVSLSGEPTLIGTGFWVTDKGHLVTAWHVIEENIDDEGVDAGPIYAICMTPDRTHVPRTLRKSYRDKIFDLALSETSGGDDPYYGMTWPLPMTLDHPEVGDEISTHAFVAKGQQFFEGPPGGTTTSKFSATLYVPDLDLTYSLEYMTRRETGQVRMVFSDARDSVMLPFPCFQSEMPIYGANSGGPVFDAKGRICGVNCSSYEGTNISFHVPIKGVLDLWARQIELIPEDPIPRGRTLFELGLAKRVRFNPPLASVYFTRTQRLVLWPWQTALLLIDWVRWIVASCRSSSDPRRPK